jgi:hypothetical protein
MLILHLLTTIIPIPLLPLPLLLITIKLGLLLVSVLSQIPSLTCIGTLILEISLQEFFDRPAMWESI